MLALFTNLIKNNTAWMEKKQNTILSAAAIITLANFASSLSALIRQNLLISTYYGSPSSQAAFDAFLFAFQIPEMMYQLIIIGALSAAFIPIFSKYKKIDAEQAFHMTSIMMNILLAIFMAAGVVIFIAAPQLTAWRAGSEYQPEQIAIVVNLTRIMIGAQLFFGVSNFFTGMLQSYHRFIIPSLSPVLYNIGILLGVYLFADKFGIYAAGLGVVLGAFMHMIVQVPLVYKIGFRYSLSFNYKFAGIKEFFRLMPPRVLTLSVDQLRVLALGFFATSLSSVSFTVVQLGLMLMTIPIRFFGVPISQASLPFLSEEADDQDRRRYNDLVLQSLHQIAFFTFPMSVLLLILRVPAVRIAFGASNFPWTTTVAVGRVVAILAISIGAQAMTQLLIRSFYALKDTRTPFYVSIANVALYLILCVWFTFFSNWGVLGIATATTASAFLEFALLLILLNRRVHGLLSKGFWLPQLKMVIASFMMAVFLYLPFRAFDEFIFDTTRTIELLALTISTGTIGMLVYIGFAALLNIRELNIFVKMFRAFEGWRLLSKSKELLVESPVEGDEI